MPSTITDRLAGLTTSVAIKAPCRVATTANIALTGLQTIDGVALVAGDRVLVKNQTSTVDNGIWTAGSGAWSRTADFDGSLDVVTGTRVFVHSGTANTGSEWRITTTGAITIGTTGLAFSPSPASVGQAYDVGLFNAISSATVVASVNVVQTSGFHTLGKGKARYKRSSAGLASWGSGVWWAQSADGAYWELSEEYPTSHMFGCYSDATRALNTTVVSGTDDTVALNRLLYYAETVGNGVAIGSRGAHFTSDTIHVGTGINSFRSVRLLGEVTFPWGTKHDAQTSFPSFEIKTNKNDRPCINVQGARSSAVWNVSLEGPLYTYIYNNLLGRSDGSPTTTNDVPISAWQTGAANHTYGRYTPGAGIAIDGFAGTALTSSGAWPASTAVSLGAVYTNGGNYYRVTVAGTTAGAGGPTGTTLGASITDNTVTWTFIGSTADGIAYPTVAYPVSTTQYGKPFSSEVNLFGVKIAGFTCGVALQPCDADGNADFVRLKDCSTTECVYGISIGNSQSRNVEIRNLNYVHLHTLIVNNKHGRQVGKLGGPIDNISGGQSIQLFDLNMGYAGAVKFTNSYAEGLWRFGNATGVGLVEIHGEHIMEGSTATGMFPIRGLPMTLFGTAERSTTGGSTISTTRLVLRGVIKVPHVAMLASKNVDTTGTVVHCTNRGTASVSTWEAQAHNALGGGIFAAASPAAAYSHKLGSQFTLHDVSSGAVASATLWDGDVFADSKRIYGCPYSARWLRAVQSQTPVPRAYEIGAYGEASLTSKTRTNNDVSFTIAGASTLVNRYHLSVGDLIWHEGSGAVMAIRSRSTNDFIARLLNGYLDTDGVISFPQGEPNWSTATYYFYGGRDYLPDYPIAGDFTSASASIADVGTGEDSFGTSANFTDGDGFAVNVMEEHTIPAGATVSSRDAGARTITMSANATKTEADRRLMFRRTV